MKKGLLSIILILVAIVCCSIKPTPVLAQQIITVETPMLPKQQQPKPKPEEKDLQIILWAMENKEWENLQKLMIFFRMAD